MKHKKGQVLVMLVVFISIMTAITAMAVNLVINTSSSASKFENSVVLLQAAESGAEIALIKLLRNPVSYNGETFTINDASVTVNITGSSTKTLISTAQWLTLTKSVQLVINEPVDSPMTVTSWTTIY